MNYEELLKQPEFLTQLEKIAKTFPVDSEEKKVFTAAILASGELKHLSLLKRFSGLLVNARREGPTGYQLIELINCTIELAGIKQTPESKLLEKEIEKVITKFILGT